MGKSQVDLRDFYNGEFSREKIPAPLTPLIVRRSRKRMSLDEWNFGITRCRRYFYHI